MPVYNLSRLFSFAFRHVILLSIYQKNIIKAIKTIVKIKLKNNIWKLKNAIKYINSKNEAVYLLFHISPHENST